MPLSKARNRERMKLIRLHAREMQPKVGLVQPKVIPKLPWYAGASDHFGEVKSHYYAEQFFSNLFQGVS